MLSIPVVYGNAVKWEGDEKQGRKHMKWIAYLKSPYGNDLSTFVSSVTFHIHETFLRPQIKLTKPPYEIKELGWGEFPVGITVAFQRSLYPPVSFTFQLRLFASEVLRADHMYKLFETADEFIFFNPTPEFKALLQIERPLGLKYSIEDKKFNGESIPAKLALINDTFTAALIETERKTQQLRKATSNNRLRLECIRQVISERSPPSQSTVLSTEERQKVETLVNSRTQN
ncbi:putative YEATS family protein [Blattamonas nauphoetae]|uniref:YEATS family protein n=1 Tax=Blattamonas nauphoetae TaxID=2049346 RepID=A0ABQ9YFQ6_9EUKA|nr:putative YEATS family protein [Blattamonas nauphoetae]